jgi:hypothetical protein
MSFQASNWAVTVKTGSPSGKAVLMAIANYAGSHGECYPSIATLAEDSEQSEDSVRRRLAELVERGIIARLERTRKNGSRTTNKLVLLFSDEAKAYARGLGWDGGAIANCEGGPLANCEGAPRTGARGALALVRPPEQPLNNQINSPLPPKGAGEGDLLSDENQIPPPPCDWWRFEANWPWQTGEGKGKAERAFKRLSKPDQKNAVAGIVLFMAAVGGRDHRPHALSYISDRQWTYAGARRSMAKAAASASSPGQKVTARPLPSGSWFLDADGPELSAWHAHERRTSQNGKAAGGCMRPTRWPPDHPPAAGSALVPGQEDGRAPDHP